MDIKEARASSSVETSFTTNNYNHRETCLEEQRLEYKMAAERPTLQLRIRLNALRKEQGALEDVSALRSMGFAGQKTNAFNFAL